MKIILFTLLTTFALTGIAQQPLTVTVNNENTTDSKHSFWVDVPQVTLKDIKGPWHKYLAKGSKGKFSYTGGAYIQNGAVNSNISPYPFTLYSTLTETTAGVHITLSLIETNPAAISNTDSNNRSLAIKKYLYDFAGAQYRKAVKAELETERHKLQELEKNMAGIIKNGEQSNKVVKKNERSNLRSEDAIVTNNNDIKTSDKQISDQKDMVQTTAADPNAAKGAEKTLREMKKDKQDLQRKNEAENKNIEGRNKENRAEDRSIKLSQQNREEMASAIEAQKQVVNAVQAKLDNIQ